MMVRVTILTACAKGSVARFPAINASTPEYPQNQRNDHRYNQSGGNRKEEMKTVTLDVDVSREPAKPEP
jgi:hypothetical protein